MHSEKLEDEAYVRSERAKNEKLVQQAMGARGLEQYRELCRLDLAPLRRDPLELVRAEFTRKALLLEIEKAERAACVTIEVSVSDLKALLAR